MPRNPSITYNDVAAIAERLQAMNVRPTVSMILDNHGSGSRGTIHRLLKEWEGEKVKRIEPSAVLPAPIQGMLLDLIGKEISAATLPLEEKLLQSEQAADELARENDRQTEALDAIRDEAATLQAALANGEGRIALLEAELAEARDMASRERGAAEQARTDLAKAQLRLEGMPALQHDLAEMRAQIEAERERRIAAEKNHAIAIAQRDSLEARITEAKEQLSDGKAQVERTTKSLQLERDEVRRLGLAVADLRVAAESAHRDALEAKAQSERLVAELNNLREVAEANHPAVVEEVPSKPE